MTDTATPTHTPCCSSHGVDMTCEKYRRTHFVEVRPCCSADADALRRDVEAWAADQRFVDANGNPLQGSLRVTDRYAPGGVLPPAPTKET